MNKSSTGGVSVFTVLFLLFLGLRLGGVISWPWIWVFAPVWIPFAIGLVCIIVYIAISLSRKRRGSKR